MKKLLDTILSRFHRHNWIEINLPVGPYDNYVFWCDCPGEARIKTEEKSSKKHWLTFKQYNEKISQWNTKR